MARYEIPQFIDVENRIIGPITFKQLIYFFAVAALLAIFWFLLKPLYFFLLAIPTVIVTLLFAFLRIEGRSFFSFFSALFQYMFKPQTFIWKRSRPDIEKESAQALGYAVSLSPKSKQTQTKQPDILKAELEKLKDKQIHQIAEIMDNF